METLYCQHGCMWNICIFSAISSYRREEEDFMDSTGYAGSLGDFSWIC